MAQTSVVDKPLQLIPLSSEIPSSSMEQKSIGAERETVQLQSKPSQTLTPVSPSPQTFVAPSATRAGEIKVEGLRTIDVNTIGLLTADTGGFAFDMWAGTERRRIQRLLSRLPENVASSALRDLARKLLLTASEIPSVEAGGEGTEKETEVVLSESLLSIRIQKLSRLGFLQEAVDLASRAGEAASRDQAILNTVLTAKLLQGNLAEACLLVRAVENYLAEAEWQKRLILCQLLDQNMAGARLGLALLEEEGEADPLFFALVNKIMRQDQKMVLPPVDNPDPLELALLRLAEEALPPSLLEKPSLQFLKLFVEDPRTPLETRLQAGETAVRAGLIPPSTLAELYRSIVFSNDEKNRRLELAKTGYGPRARALLYQGAVDSEIPINAVPILEKSLELAAGHNSYRLMALMHGPQIQAMRVSPNLWPFAKTAARTLYTMGRVAVAQQWVDLLVEQSQRHQNLTAQENLKRLWAFLRIFGVVYSPEQEEDYRRTWVKNIVAERAAFSQQDAARHIYLAYGLLEALGLAPVSEAAWTELLEIGDIRGEHNLNPVHLNFLSASAAAGRVGETVAWVLHILGETGVKEAAPVAVIETIKALRTVGLTKEARMLALEVAADNNL